MALSKVIPKTALKKLEDQLTCAICLDAFKDPKLLQCFHVFCKDCLQQLVVQDQQGRLSLCCPNCRQSTILPPPATDVSSLMPAFHIHNLFEIQKALENMEMQQHIQCKKCVKQRATCFCRGCNKFICEKCLEVHNQWKELAKHEVISVEQIKSNPSKLVSPKKVILYCSLHQDKELDIYCETCEELICLHCTVKKHKDHQYDLVVDTFETHKAEMTAAVEPIENQRSLTTNAKKQLGVRLQELDDQRDALKADIERDIQRFQGLLEARKMKLFDQVDQHVERKKKNLVTQQDELETIEIQQASYLSFVKGSLDAASQIEVMRVKKIAMKRFKTLADNFKQDMLSPHECANVKFIASSELELACQRFGEVYLREASPTKCYATGEGLSKAESGERASAVMYVVNEKGEACSTPIETVTCELVSETASEKTECCLKKMGVNQFEISYQPTRREKSQLIIKVEDEHIKGSPFAVMVKLPVEKLGTPTMIIRGVNGAMGVAFNQMGDIIVSELGMDRVSIFTAVGDKIKSFGSCGSYNGQFSKPEGLAVDADNNILVADCKNHRIQMFTSDGYFITGVGKCGKKHLEFRNPCSVVLNPVTAKIYVVDCGNHRIQILNSDLSFCSSFGGCGSDNGQFVHPRDIAFDSAGKMYVTDSLNHRIQVFTAKGDFLRKFGKMGNGVRQLDTPNCIAIDSDDVIYVTEGSNHRVSIFTCNGDFLTLFGQMGTRPGQFDVPYGIAVDKNGVVYVADCLNNRIQLF